MANTKKENSILPEKIKFPSFYKKVATKKLVTVRGIGTFQKLKSKPYVHYNVKTGVKTEKAVRLRILFRPTLGFRNYLKSYAKLDSKK